MVVEEFCKFRSVPWGCIGGRSEDPPRGSRETTQSSNSAMQSQRMRAFVSPYSRSPSSSSGRALRSDQASFRFRLSVSARFVSRASRSPYPASRTMQGEQRTPRMISENDRSPGPSRVTTRSISLRAYRKFSEPFFFENESRWRTSSFSNG